MIENNLSLNENSNINNEQDDLKSKFQVGTLGHEFIMHFGEMGNSWGINRTVGQIYALIYISPRPLNADEIADVTNFSRSNVSMGLKELQSWNLIKLKHQFNDRKEYFYTYDDIWKIFKTLAIQRKKREVEPTLTMLRNSLLENAISQEEQYAQKRMKEMHDFIETLSTWFDDVQDMDSQSLFKLMGMGIKVKKFLDHSIGINKSKGD